MKYVQKLALFFTFFLFSLALDAQCVMCKMNVENGEDGYGKIGGGLNDGILFLMAFPYLVLAFVLFSYRKKVIAFLKDFKNIPNNN